MDPNVKFVELMQIYACSIIDQHQETSVCTMSFISTLRLQLSLMEH